MLCICSCRISVSVPLLDESTRYIGTYDVILTTTVRTRVSENSVHCFEGVSCRVTPADAPNICTERCKTGSQKRWVATCTQAHTQIDAQHDGTRFASIYV